MDDLFAINTAKSEFRDAFNYGDVNRILAIADPDLVSFSDGEPSEFGQSGLDALQSRLTDLFARYTAKLAVMAVEIRVQDRMAHAYGWQELTLAPKNGGDQVRRRTRYVDVWRRNEQGSWKLWMYIDNQDVPDKT
jgi:ketosteroid isomerase-like protein